MKRVCSFFLAAVLCFGLTAPAVAAEFSDVGENYVFYDAIQDCVSKGILTGYRDGTFLPAETVTRAQFTVMLARAFYPGESDAYADLEKTIGWYAPYAAALDAHQAAGYGKTHWSDPSVMSGRISRNDMARFIVSVMTAKGYRVSDESKAAAQAKITDYSQIPESFREEIKTVFALGIITGFADGSFSGSNTMTRGQAAMVIYRMTQCLAEEPGTLPPALQEAKPAPTTLTNGEAVTEANVLAMLAELKAQYPEGMDFSMGYPLGESSPVRLATHPYFRERNPSGHSSSTLGCGGWTTLLSDAMLGQDGFPTRKAALADARPGDIMVQLNKSGLLIHIAMITDRPKTTGGRTTFTVTEAATDAEGVYRLHWDVGYTAYTDRYDYAIYTRYPA